MRLTDQFREPHEWWDEYTARADERYAAMTDGKTCLDCDRCRKCDIEGHSDIGFCMENGEFCDGSETVAQLGLECFEAAA